VRVRQALTVLSLIATLLTSAGSAQATGRHLVGFGFGGGVRASSHDLAVIAPELMLPDFELGFFGPHERSVDLVIPILRMVASAVLVERLWIGADVYPTFRRRLREFDGGGSAWGLAGPGLGFMISSGRGNATAGPRLAGRLGVELRNSKQGTVCFLVQPYVLAEFGDIGAALSGGAQAVMRVAWIR
jgi:hypothetical protein